MRQGREYWSRHVTAWRRSGLTKKAYCEQQCGVVPVWWTGNL